MSKPQYRHAHQQERERWKPAVEAGHVECVEPICLEELDGRTRWLRPLNPWHLSHDAATGEWIGPSHPRCNIAEANRRKASKAAREQTRWVM